MFWQHIIINGLFKICNLNKQILTTTIENQLYLNRYNIGLWHVFIPSWV
jgi:hypothetical protein